MATSAQARQTLIDNPPSKCPYFTLPDVSHFPRETRASGTRKKTGYVSIVALWGPSGRMTVETTTEFLLQLLKHSSWEPDFDAIAAEWQLKGTSHIKSRLKSIVEGNGYKLVGESRIVDGDGPPKSAIPLKKKASEKAKAKKQGPTGKEVEEGATKTFKAAKTSQYKKRKAKDDGEASKSKSNKKQKQAKEVTSAGRESPLSEPQQDTTKAADVRKSTSLEESAHSLGAQKVVWVTRA